MQRWFSKRTSSQPAPDPAAKKRLLVLSVLGLAVAGLAWWTMFPGPAPAQPQVPARTSIPVPAPVVQPLPVAEMPAPAHPVPVPSPVLVDPFQTYQQLAGRGETAPAVPVPPPARAVVLPPPPPPVLTPAAPAPARPPAPPTLAEWVRMAGWSVEAIGVGAQTSVLLGVGEHSGFYRVGETVENSIRIVRIDPDRVVLARGAERAVLEVR